MGTGAFLVDGTAASCYAIPENWRESAIYKRLSEVASAASLQATYHALFLPLRLTCRRWLGYRIWRQQLGKGCPDPQGIVAGRRAEKCWSYPSLCMGALCL